ncbi:MAG: SMC-Scp complex subunit ScpB [Planctomycetes bacterium]|nr:SMC-Scp complex subunit ScpB [Planctomycetota bacterium]
MDECAARDDGERHEAGLEAGAAAGTEALGTDAPPRSFAALRPGPAVPLRIDPFRPVSDELAGDELAGGELGGDAPVDFGRLPTVDAPRRLPAIDHDGAGDDLAAVAPTADVRDAAEVETSSGDSDATPAAVADGEAAGAVVAERAFVPVEPELELDEEALAAELDALVDPDTAAADLALAAPRAVDADDELPVLVEPHELSRVLMAVLLSSREPSKLLRLAEVCNSTQKAVLAALERLQSDLRNAGMPIEVVYIGDAVRLATSPEVYGYLVRLRKARRAEKLSPAALETLAVVAYRQPVIRAEIEAIRGVKVGPMLKSLLDHKLVKVVGRADVPGRPLQYGTTQTFLERFGLASLKDLPSIQEFRSLG